MSIDEDKDKVVSENMDAVLYLAERAAELAELFYLLGSRHWIQLKTKDCFAESSARALLKAPRGTSPVPWRYG